MDLTKEYLDQKLDEMIEEFAHIVAKSLEHVATKEDLKQFATKEDLKKIESAMVTKEFITTLSLEPFAHV